MDSFELNKIAGAVLFCMLVIAGVNNLGDILIAPNKLTENAYKVDVPEEAVAGNAGQGAKPEEPVKPIAELLASADAKKGEAAFKKCAACHTAEKGGPNKIGPNLWGIVGAKRAHIDGFAYSSALQGKSGEWDYDSLFQFITNPKGFVPGTKMAFAGIRKVDERADIIAWLRTLSDNPLPLPQK